jgi:hypothetical protein
MSKRRKVVSVQLPNAQTPHARYKLSCGHWVTILCDDGKHPPKTLLCRQCSC